jgi:biopolymer transport protein ExbB
MDDRLLINAFEFIRTGGPIMLPLLALSIWLWVLILLTLVRVAAFAPGRRDSRMQRDLKMHLHGQMESYRSTNPKLDRRLLDTILAEMSRPLRASITTIFVLASAAPLLGLLGTVTGMIDTFEAVAQFGTGNAKALASGISEAMITTQTGLMVAVPGMVAGYILRRKASKIWGRLESYGLALLKNGCGGVA